MPFLNPHWLVFSTAAAVVVGAGLYRAARRGRRDLERFAEMPLLAAVWGEVRSRTTLRGVLLVAALMCAGLALAGPLYGEREVTVRPTGADVVVALDVSLSMSATDVKPSRLRRAVRQIEELLDLLPGHRVGLVVFSGDAYLGVPLTLDHGAVRLFLDAVEAGMVPTRGSSLEAAVEVAAQALEGGGGGPALVLFSDGETTAGNLDNAVAKARAAKMRVFAVGTGETEGVPIPLYDDHGRLTGYKRDRNGAPVSTRLETEALSRLARETGGGFHVSSLTGGEVGDIAQAAADLAGGQEEAQRLARLENRYQWPLALAFLLLAVELLLPPVRRVSRPGEAP